MYPRIRQFNRVEKYTKTKRRIGFLKIRGTQIIKIRKWREIFCTYSEIVSNASKAKIYKQEGNIKKN